MVSKLLKPIFRRFNSDLFKGSYQSSKKGSILIILLCFWGSLLYFSEKDSKFIKIIPKGIRNNFEDKMKSEKYFVSSKNFISQIFYQIETSNAFTDNKIKFLESSLNVTDFLANESENWKFFQGIAQLRILLQVFLLMFSFWVLFSILKIISLQKQIQTWENLEIKSLSVNNDIMNDPSK